MSNSCTISFTTNANLYITTLTSTNASINTISYYNGANVSYYSGIIAVTSTFGNISTFTQTGMYFISASSYNGSNTNWSWVSNLAYYNGSNYYWASPNGGGGNGTNPEYNFINTGNLFTIQIRNTSSSQNMKYLIRIENY